MVGSRPLVKNCLVNGCRVKSIWLLLRLGCLTGLGRVRLNCVKKMSMSDFTFCRLKRWQDGEVRYGGR